MDIIRFAEKTKKVLSDNSPVILTALGVTGTVTTAYLTAKATFKAARTIDDAKFIRRQKDGALVREGVAIRKDPLTNKEKFGLTWKFYVPAVATGVGTVTCIVAANYIGTKRAAALAAAYNISQQAINEYKEKVIDRVGEAEEADIRREIAQDRVDKNPPGNAVVVVGSGDVLMHDAYTDRYFMSTKNAVEKAQNSINYQINRSDTASLTEFYDKIGLEPTSVSDEMGWNSETNLELLWSTVETPDGRPCLSFDFATIPIYNPDALFLRTRDLCM